MLKQKLSIAALVMGGIMLVSGCGNGSSAQNAGTQAGTIDFNSLPSTQEGNIGEVKLNKGDLYAVISVEGYGDITAKLYHDVAPEGVENFVKLAQEGYYDGKIIHRVVSDFMLQGGSKNGDGMSSADEYQFGVEYNTNMRHFFGALCYANAGGMNSTQFYVVNSRKYEPLTEEQYNGTISYYESMAAQAQALLDKATDPNEKAYYESVIAQVSSIASTYKKQLSAFLELSDTAKAKYEAQGGSGVLDGGYTVFGQTVDGFDVIDKISAVEVVDNGGGELSSPVQKIVIETVKIYIAE